MQRDEEIVVAGEEPAFSLACFNCDAGDGIGSIEQAIAEHWRGIHYDDGLGWNYLGVCPHCAPDWYGPTFEQIPFGWERRSDVEALFTKPASNWSQL